MLMTPLTKALLTVAGVSITGVLATVAGLSVEGFLGIIVALNGIELALIVANTARISNLSGRYDADHD